MTVGCEQSREVERIAERTENLSAEWAPKLEAASGHLTKLRRRAERIGEQADEARELNAFLSRTAWRVQEAKQALTSLTQNVQTALARGQLQQLEEECEHVESLAAAAVDALEVELQSVRGRLAALELSLARASKGRPDEMYRRTLHTGFVVSGLPNGTEQQLLDFLESDAGASESGWFLLDRLFFETDSADLDLTVSSSQIESITHVLKAHRRATLNIAHYRNGTEHGNVLNELSRRRVESVLNQLVAHGVEGHRLAAGGQAPERPPCPGDSASDCPALEQLVAVQIARE